MKIQKQSSEQMPTPKAKLPPAQKTELFIYFYFYLCIWSNLFLGLEKSDLKQMYLSQKVPER